MPNNWTPLPTDYTDATWVGNKKYQLSQNPDGTTNIQDVTVYTNKENSFFGAADANAMNGAINTIMEEGVGGQTITVPMNNTTVTEFTAYEGNQDGFSYQCVVTVTGCDDTMKAEWTPNLDKTSGMTMADFNKWVGSLSATNQVTLYFSSQPTKIVISEFILTPTKESA